MTMMSARILIGDVGSSSGKWGVLEDGTSWRFATAGYNPVSHGVEAWRSMSESLVHQCPGADQVFYYGAGVSSAQIASEVRHALVQLFPHASIEIESDLLGAARALCGNETGNVVILGTGSSVCAYDGKTITRTLPSLGFPLGDEGSGWRIGLAMVRGYYYGTMPNSLREEFGSVLPEDRHAFLAAFKKAVAPNAYLASFATFAASHAEHPWVHDCLLERLAELVNVLASTVDTAATVHCSGGIANQFEKQLREVFKAAGFTCGSVIGDPLQYLLTYHKQKL